MTEQHSNHLAEWFGHRVYPQVAHGTVALADQQAELCPFLSRAKQEDQKCIKQQTSSGVCTVNSLSNGPRQDWLVCPHRAMDQSLLTDVASHLFGIEQNASRLIWPASTLGKQEVRNSILTNVKAGNSVVIYFHDKLGGEISFSETDRSPEMKLDVTLVEIKGNDAGLSVGRYGILELQTMEFHGSYRHAVKNLKDALRLFKEEFHPTVQQNQKWLAEEIEGPNVANVFKRTFYQMMFKFQIGEQPSCAGCILAISEAVWDSWQRHLGKPVLRQRRDDWEMFRPDHQAPSNPPAWIYVYNLNDTIGVTPNPIQIQKRIATNADSVGYYALNVAPQVALSEGGAINLLPIRIAQRIALWWPEFGKITLP